MRHTLTLAPVAVLAFLAAVICSALAVRAGIMPEDAVRLWAASSIAGDGGISIDKIVAVFPTLPFLATTLASAVAPLDTPASALVAAAALALIACLWYDAFRSARLPAAAAFVITALLVFHPAMLRAAIGGPADVFLALFLFLLARGLYDLRARSTTSEVMTVGLALLGVAFSHPVGAAVAVAAVPVLVFAVRPVLVANSAFNVVTALVFPTVFAFVAFTYVSWVFPGAGWTFFAAPAQSLAAWDAGMASVFGNGLTGSKAVDAALATLVMILLGAPVAEVATRWVMARRPLVTPALVFIAAMSIAAALSVTTGLFGAPTAIAVAAPVLAAVVIMKVPVVRERLPVVIALLAAGWIGGAASLVLIDPATALRVQAVLTGHDGVQQRLDTLALGGAIAKFDGVLVDTENAPAVIVARGHARGVLGPASEAYALTRLLSHIEAPYVAVPDPHSELGLGDQLNKVFPTLFVDGAKGYRLIYQNNTWRLFARTGEQTALKRLPGERDDGELLEKRTTYAKLQRE